MLLPFTEVKSGQCIAINPKHIVAVFIIGEGDHIGKTGISVLNGQLIVGENYLETIGRINGELK
jgi:hypothetical protein